MCQYLLCLQLKESLDAAFRGHGYEGQETVRAWGLNVVNALHSRHPQWCQSHSLVWRIANNNLQNMLLNCPCEGLAEAVLHNPETFLRTALVLASSLPEEYSPARPKVLH